MVVLPPLSTTALDALPMVVVPEPEALIVVAPRALIEADELPIVTVPVLVPVPMLVLLLLLLLILVVAPLIVAPAVRFARPATPRELPRVVAPLIFATPEECRLPTFVVPVIVTPVPAI